MKILKKAINIITPVIMVCAVLILLCAVFTPSGQAPSILGISVFRTLTGSMEPTIPVDAMVVVKRVPAEALKAGDIITFYSSDPALEYNINTHRINEVTVDGSSVLFQTKGDANGAPDKYLVSAENIVGKVVGVSLVAGKLSAILVQPIVFLPIILIPLVLVLLECVRNMVLTVKKLGQEQEAQEREELLAAWQELKEKRTQEQLQTPKQS